MSSEGQSRMVEASVDVDAPVLTEHNDGDTGARQAALARHSSAFAKPIDAHQDMFVRCMRGRASVIVPARNSVLLGGQSLPRPGLPVETPRAPYALSRNIWGRHKS